MRERVTLALPLFALSLSLDNALSMQARVSGVRFVRVWETKGRTLSPCVCMCVRECLRHVLVLFWQTESEAGNYCAALDVFNNCS